MLASTKNDNGDCIHQSAYFKVLLSAGYNFREGRLADTIFIIIVSRWQHLP